MNERPTIVLVHGAFTDASIWHDVIAHLHVRGHRVAAPAMPMRGLASDGAYLRSVLAAIDGSVTVAAHSYGGSVVSDPDALTPNVTSLAFIAAFQQDAHETAAELNARFPGSRLTPEAMVVRDRPGGGSDLSLREDRFAEIYASDVDPARAAVMAAAQHPLDPAALSESFSGTASWRTLPSWTLVSTADVSIPTEALRFMADRAGSTVSEVATAHAAPVSRPAETADVIAAAASSARTGQTR